MSREFYSSQQFTTTCEVIAFPFEPEKKEVLFGEAVGSKDAIAAFIKAHRLMPIIIMR